MTLLWESRTEPVCALGRTGQPAVGKQNMAGSQGAVAPMFFFPSGFKLDEGSRGSPNMS